MAYMSATGIAAPHRASRRMRPVLTGTERRTTELDGVLILARAIPNPTRFFDADRGASPPLLSAP